MAAAANRTLEARLSRKVGPLPVWAWAASILGLFLLYSHFHTSTGTAAAQPDTTAVPAATGDGTAQLPSSGQGSAVDNLNQGLLDQLGANTASIDALTTQLLETANYSVPMNDGGPPGASSQAGPASSPTQPSVITGAVAAPHQTQTTAGILSWDGINFTSRKSFDQWAAKHGTSPTTIFKTHPQAKALYSTLKP